MVISAQTPICDEVPISYDPSGIAFTTADQSFGDSVITVPITNNHPTQGFAYPQAKVIALTTLPPGMTLNTHWATFSSSWNPGQTMPASFFFDVITPIPQDYAVTFEMWAYNLTPVLDDSCIFDSTFTINLNPVSTGMHEMEAGGGGPLWPVPVSDRLHINLPHHAPPFVHVLVCNAEGREVLTAVARATGSSAVVDMRDLVPGVYLVTVMGNDGPLLRRRVVVGR
jgi:hypothetical protein